MWWEEFSSLLEVGPSIEERNGKKSGGVRAPWPTLNSANQLLMKNVAPRTHVAL
jgi:hypothetical protein